jgi:hypothetical protein
VIGPPSPQDEAILREEHKQYEVDRAKERREAARERQEQTALLEKRKEELERSRRAEILDRVKNLKIRSRLERNVLDSNFRENLATYHREEVLRNRETIFQEYTELIGDDELVSSLRQEAPEVLEFMEAVVELFQLAERKEAETPKAGIPLALPQATSRPRRKLSEEQIRAGKAYRKLRQARDKAAEKLAVLDSVLEFQDALEKYPLDDDEKMRLSQDYVDEISVEEGGNGTKKLG